MNKTLTNKFNSYQNTIRVLKNRRDVYGVYPIAEAAVNEFQALIENIKVTGEKTDFDYKKLTTKKQKVKDALAEQISGMAAASSMYAREIDDPDLEAIASTSYSDVRQARDFETLELARGFMTLLLKHKEALAGYMIEDNDLNELQRLISEFDNLYEIREEVHSESVMDTQRLEVLFRKADDVLYNKVDKVVKKLKLVNLDFYNSYFQARVLVDL